MRGIDTDKARHLIDDISDTTKELEKKAEQAAAVARSRDSLGSQASSPLSDSYDNSPRYESPSPNQYQQPSFSSYEGGSNPRGGLEKRIASEDNKLDALADDIAGLRRHLDSLVEKGRNLLRKLEEGLPAAESIQASIEAKASNVNTGADHLNRAGAASSRSLQELRTLKSNLTEALTYADRVSERAISMAKSAGSLTFTAGHKAGSFLSRIGSWMYQQITSLYRPLQRNSPSPEEQYNSFPTYNAQPESFYEVYSQQKDPALGSGKASHQHTGGLENIVSNFARTVQDNAHSADLSNHVSRSSLQDSTPSLGRDSYMSAGQRQLNRVYEYTADTAKSCGKKINDAAYSAVSNIGNYVSSLGDMLRK